jgi:hypothetical protein
MWREGYWGNTNLELCLGDICMKRRHGSKTVRVSLMKHHGPIPLFSAVLIALGGKHRRNERVAGQSIGPIGTFPKLSARDMKRDVLLVSGLHIHERRLWFHPPKEPCYVC